MTLYPMTSYPMTLSPTPKTKYKIELTQLGEFDKQKKAAMQLVKDSPYVGKVSIQHKTYSSYFEAVNKTAESGDFEPLCALLKARETVQDILRNTSDQLTNYKDAYQNPFELRAIYNRYQTDTSFKKPLRINYLYTERPKSDPSQDSVNFCIPVYGNLTNTLLFASEDNILIDRMVTDLDLALYKAAKKCQTQCVHILLQSGANPEWRPDTGTSHGQTQGTSAVDQSFNKDIDTLIEQAVKKNIPKCQYPDKLPSLINLDIDKFNEEKKEDISILEKMPYTGMATCQKDGKRESSFTTLIHDAFNENEENCYLYVTECLKQWDPIWSVQNKFFLETLLTSIRKDYIKTATLLLEKGWQGQKINDKCWIGCMVPSNETPYESARSDNMRTLLVQYGAKRPDTIHQNSSNKPTTIKQENLLQKTTTQVQHSSVEIDPTQQNSDTQSNLSQDEFDDFTQCQTLQCSIL
ncbi:MAG: hypothetical protein S4CHLAM7_12420 [Chlamydiae bacterium]|nr:hypothetical protein [Chlamydiota bacterium]